jgi:hypothetical protein
MFIAWEGCVLMFLFLGAAWAFGINPELSGFLAFRMQDRCCPPKAANALTSPEILARALGARARNG